MVDFVEHGAPGSGDLFGSPRGDKGLVGGYDDLALRVEVDLDDGGFFAEGCLRVVAEEGGPPSAGVVLKEACAAGAGDGLVAGVVGAVDVVGHGEAGGVAAFVAVGCAEVVAAVGLEED